MTVARVATGLIILLLTPIIYFIGKYTIDVMTNASAGGFNTATWPTIGVYGLGILMPGVLVYCLFWAFSHLHPRYKPGGYEPVGPRLRKYTQPSFPQLDLPTTSGRKKTTKPPKWTGSQLGVPYNQNGKKK